MNRVKIKALFIFLVFPYLVPQFVHSASTQEVVEKQLLKFDCAGFDLYASRVIVKCAGDNDRFNRVSTALHNEFYSYADKLCENYNVKNLPDNLWSEAIKYVNIMNSNDDLSVSATLSCRHDDAIIASNARISAMKSFYDLFLDNALDNNGKQAREKFDINFFEKVSQEIQNNLDEYKDLSKLSDGQRWSKVLGDWGEIYASGDVDGAQFKLWSDTAFFLEEKALMPVLGKSVSGKIVLGQKNLFTILKGIGKEVMRYRH